MFDITGAQLQHKYGVELSEYVHQTTLFWSTETQNRFAQQLCSYMTALSIESLHGFICLFGSRLFVESIKYFIGIYRICSISTTPQPWLGVNLHDIRSNERMLIIF